MKNKHKNKKSSSKKDKSKKVAIVFRNARQPPFNVASPDVIFSGSPQIIEHPDYFDSTLPLNSFRTTGTTINPQPNVIFLDGQVGQTISKL